MARQLQSSFLQSFSSNTCGDICRISRTEAAACILIYVEMRSQSLSSDCQRSSSVGDGAVVAGVVYDNVLGVDCSDVVVDVDDAVGGDVDCDVDVAVDDHWYVCHSMCPGFQPVSPYPASHILIQTILQEDKYKQIVEDLCKLDPVCVVTDPGEDSRQPRLKMPYNNDYEFP